MPETRPNILLITSDQQHWNTLGRSNPELRTPNLDRLADSGTVFTRAYCPNPTCTPTRASMITGKYPSQHGAYSLGTKLPETEPTIGDHFRRAGYHTALIGKAHFQPLASTPQFPSLESYPTLQDLAFWDGFRGPFYGFERIELARNHTDEPHVGQHYALWMEARGLSDWRDHFQPPTGNQPKQTHRWSIPTEYHYNTWIAERTTSLLEQYSREGSPFLLWSSFFDPHPSYLVPAPWDTMYNPASVTVPGVTGDEHRFNPPHFRLALESDADYTYWTDEPGGDPRLQGIRSHVHDRDALAQDIAVYYGMISCMDHAIGQILDALQQYGLEENTLVAFTSDHGHLFGHHGLVSKGPFHYEDMVRVPFIVSHPGHVPAGVESEALQSLVDLAPTFLTYCDVEADPAMTGVDQTDVWCGRSKQARPWVVVENRHQPTRIHIKTYIDSRYKLTVYLDQPDGELFDLRDDPFEVRNLWHTAAGLSLKDRLLEDLLAAEIEKEEVLSSAAEHLPQKSQEMYIKSIQRGRFRLTYVQADSRFHLSDVDSAGDRTSDLWDHPEHTALRRELVREMLFERMRREPMWMPRVHGA